MVKYKIYPKQFRNEKIPIEKNRCFFIMPFSEEFDIIYGEIKEALSKSNYICIRVDEIPGSIPIINKILTEILKAQFIIADLTNCNPNVFYELGIAHTFKDAENIFLLKEKNSKIPFDITHLTYLEYDKNNLHYLTAKLKNSLSSNKYLSDFYELLNTLGIIQYVHDNQDEFVEVLKEILGNEIIFATNLLNYTNDNYDEKTVEAFIERLDLQIKKCISLYDSSLLVGIIDFYGEILLACNKYKFIQEFLIFFLSDYFITTSLSDTDIVVYKTNMALKFANAGKQLNIVMPWIISYFKRSRSATIDLNRYKIESFLLTTQSKKINSDICTALADIDAHVREHIADIIGEKKLIEATQILHTQLLAEQNYYAASSMIEALGKIGNHDSLKYINMWFVEHEHELISTKHFFIFKHIRIAVAKLDATYSKNFEEKYKDYFNQLMW